MQMGLIKNLFSSEKEILHIYHLNHLIFILGRIADYTGNVGGRLRVMMAR